MKIIIILLLGVCSLGVLANDGCQHKCQEEKTCRVKKILNVCYYIFHHGTRTWQESKVLCDAETLTMGQISKHQILNNFNIQELIPEVVPNVNAWLGGRAVDLKKWTFINNVTVTDTLSSDPTGPTDGQEMHLCGVVSADGTLDKDDCRNMKHFICRFEDRRGAAAFYISELPHTWFEARAKCGDMQSSLFSLNKNEDAHMLKEKLKAPYLINQKLFIGLTKRRWVWQDERDIIYYNWGDKRNTFSAKCLSVNPMDGTWNAADCNEKMYTLCQTDLELNMPTVKPTADTEEIKEGVTTTKLLVISTLVLVVILLVIAVFSMCWYYKNNELPTNGRSKSKTKSDETEVVDLNEQNQANLNEDGEEDEEEEAERLVTEQTVQTKNAHPSIPNPERKSLETENQTIES